MYDIKGKESNRSRVTVEPLTDDHQYCPPNIGRGLLDDAIYQI